MEQLELEQMLQKEIVMNFFAGNHSIVFDNADDVKEFLKFIHFYDNRFDENFKRADEINEVAWLYCHTTHRHQLEWSNDEESNYKEGGYFKQRFGGFVGFEPIKYEMIKKYVALCGALDSVLESFKNLFK